MDYASTMDRELRRGRAMRMRRLHSSSRAPKQTESGLDSLARRRIARFFSRHKRTDRWHASWSKRYGGKYEEVTRFLRESRLAIRAKRLQEARQRELDQQTALLEQQAEFERKRTQDRQAERDRLRKFLYWGLAGYILLLTVSCLLIGHILLREKIRESGGRFASSVISEGRPIW